MRSVGGKFAALVALVGVALLGNMRSAASETGRAPTRAEPASNAIGVSTDPVGTADATLTERMVAAGNGDPEDAPTSPVEGFDDARLVPAIYAWDPDVRFVYFRHVHKWM